MAGRRNRNPLTLFLTVLIALCAGGLHAQDANGSITRAEVLGRLAAGESPSYVAHLVKTRGTAFSVSADYLDMVRRAGGAGILLDRLSSASAGNFSASSSANDPPFAHLAKCAEFEQMGANTEAEPECESAAQADPESPWPLLALNRCLMRLGKTEDAEAQTNRARKVSMGITEAHQGLEALLWRSSDDREIAASHLQASQMLRSADKKEEAAAEVREAIRLEPDNPENHTALGLLYENFDNIDGALAEFQEVIRLAPYDAEARERLSGFLRRQGNMAGALAAMREAVNIGPEDQQAHLDLIDLYKATGDTEGTIDEYRRFLRLVPNAYDDRLEFASLLLKKHALEEAATECQELIRRLPADSQEYEEQRKNSWMGWAHNTLGNVRLAQERIEEAVSEYQLAIQFLPDAAVTHSNVANILAHQGRLQAAIDEFRMALNLDPKDEYSHVGLGIALGRQGNLDSAKDEFDLALAMNPDDENARGSLAHVYELKGQFEQAIAEYERVLAAHSDSALAHNNLADIYLTSPDPRYRNSTTALEHARRAVELSKAGSFHTERAIFLITLANALEINGKSEEVIPALRQAVAIDPANSAAHLGLARMLESTGDHAGAASEFELEVRLQPDLASAQNDLAWFYATCPDARYRNPAASLEHASLAVKLSSTDSPNTEKAAYLDTLAEALLINQRYDEALATEQKAAEMDPHNPDIKSRMDRFQKAVRLSAIP